MQQYANNFIRDKSGQIVLWQSPNFLLWSWIILKVLAIILGAGRLKSGFEQLGTTVLFAWAYLEITKGVSYFRRLLGIVITASIIIGFFR